MFLPSPSIAVLSGLFSAGTRENHLGVTKGFSMGKDRPCIHGTVSGTSTAHPCSQRGLPGASQRAAQAKPLIGTAALSSDVLGLGRQGGGLELGLEASVTSPCRHPQEHISGAPHSPGVCFGSCCQPLQGWWGQLTKSNARYSRTKHTWASVAQVTRSSNHETRHLPAGRKRRAEEVAFALPRQPDMAPRGHRARAQLGTQRCCGRSLSSKVTHLLKDRSFGPIKHFQ